MEEGKGLLLGQRLEIDDQVAATNEVELGERGVLDDVVLGEDDHLPQFLGDLEAVAFAREVLRQALGVHFRQRGLAVDSRRRQNPARRGDVGGENLGLHRPAHRLHPLQQ